MITIDGEAITPTDAGDEAEELRQVRLEVKLCKALAVFDPPHGLLVILHGRIAGHLRTLNRQGAHGPDARQPADLTDDEFRDAAGVIRSFLALSPARQRPSAAPQPPHHPRPIRRRRCPRDHHAGGIRAASRHGTRGMRGSQRSCQG